MDCLSYAGTGDAGSKVPSLVPNWDLKEKVSKFSFRTARQFNASTGVKPWVSWVPSDPKVLQVKGRVVDTVQDVSISRFELITLDNQKTYNQSGKIDEKHFQKLLKGGIPSTYIDRSLPTVRLNTL